MRVPHGLATTESTEGTELADFEPTDGVNSMGGENWCGPWADRTDTAKTCTKSIFDANGALFLRQVVDRLVTHGDVKVVQKL